MIHAQQVQVLPLAPQQLSCPHPYDSDSEVFVQLDEPLWVPRPSAKDVAMEIISLCVQLHSIILSSRHSVEEVTLLEDHRAGKVTFAELVSNRIVAILKLMQEHLGRAGIKDSLEDYFRGSGIGSLFPWVQPYLQQTPEQQPPPDNEPSSTVQGYISYMTLLSNIRTMAQQINTDIFSSASHKYIAHQLALLYQCLGSVPQLAGHRKEIENHFTTVKSTCSPSPEGHPPRLSGPLKTWLLTVTQRLVDTTLSLPHELFTSNKHVRDILTVVHNIPP